MKLRLLVLSLITLLFFSCQPVTQETNELSEINIRLNRDPQRINPIYSPTSVGREVFQYIFLPLADFHPDDLTLHPILIESIPEAYTPDRENTVAFDIAFKDDALWSDGTPVTASDYIFTLKAIKHPLCKASAWKQYFAFFQHVEEDSKSNKKLTVYLDKEYMLSKELALTTCLMPEHIYDPEGILRSSSLSEISSLDPASLDSSHVKLFEHINGAANAKTDVVQLGPYKMTSYESEQYFVLDKVENYWGVNYPDNPFLNAHTRQLIFKIVPDEITASTMAKEGNFDIMSFATSKDFLELKNDEDLSDSWNFHTPQVMMYYYLALNNSSEFLSDVNIRKAIAYITDVDDFINNIDGGLGVRTVGHFNPTKSYYNDALTPVPYNLDKAEELLNNSGWADNNGDGYLDKNIDGINKTLELDLLITGSQLSKTIGLLVQQSAEKLGVKINITPKSTSLMRKENFSSLNYDMAALSIGQDAAPDDPYSKWHSDNSRLGGSNYFAYQNPKSDSLIDLIRRTTDVNQRHQHYLELQEIMYNDQPVIWLYCPLKKIIINKKLEALTTSKRPGYLANTFKLAN